MHKNFLSRTLRTNSIIIPYSQVFKHILKISSLCNSDWFKLHKCVKKFLRKFLGILGNLFGSKKLLKRIHFKVLSEHTRFFLTELEPRPTGRVRCTKFVTVIFCLCYRTYTMWTHVCAWFLKLPPPLLFSSALSYPTYFHSVPFSVGLFFVSFTCIQ